MQNLLSEQLLTMSSREIAELLECRHDNVKRSIERLAAQGVIQLPQSEEVKNHRGQILGEYKVGKRDSYVVVAQLSPEFTARLVDRWQELEKKIQPTLSELEMIARIASHAAAQEKRISHVEEKLTHIEQGTIPHGYQGYSYLQAQYGLSNAKCKQLVMAFSVPHKKVPHVSPSGQVTQMSVVDEYNFDSALHQLMTEAEKRGSQWYHAKLGRFTISNWEAA